MKYISTFLILILIAISCRSEDLVEKSFQGRVINEITEFGINNAQIGCSIKEVIGSGMLSYVKTLYVSNTTTNSNGDFTIKIPESHLSNPKAYLEVGKGDDENTTIFLPMDKTRFLLRNLDQNTVLLFHVRNWEYLKVKLKSNSPENQGVSIYLYQTNTNYSNSPLYKIINHGIKNDPYTYPAAENGLNPSWSGNNVDSELFYKIQNGTSFMLIWNVKRNGVWTEYKSNLIATISGQENLFEINY